MAWLVGDTIGISAEQNAPAIDVPTIWNQMLSFSKEKENACGSCVGREWKKITSS